MISLQTLSNVSAKSMYKSWRYKNNFFKWTMIGRSCEMEVHGSLVPILESQDVISIWKKIDLCDDLSRRDGSDLVVNLFIT